MLHRMRLVNSHPDNPYLMFKSHLKNGNLIRKCSLKTMNCKLELGNVIMIRQFSTQTITIRQTLIHLKLQFDLTYHPKRRRILQELPDTRVFPELFPSADGLCEGTDTYLYMEQDAEMGLEQHHPFYTNPRSSKYVLRHNLKLNCDDDYRY